MEVDVEEDIVLTLTPAPLTPRRPDGFRLPLLIACAVLSLLVVIVAAGAIAGISSVRSSAREAVTVDGQLSRLASEVATQTLESRRFEKDFFLNVADPRARSDYLAQWQTATAALDQVITAFAAAATTAEDQQQAARWRVQAADYTRAFGQVARAVADGRIASAQAANAAFTPFKENVRLLTESSVAIADHKASLAVEASATLETSGARAIWLVGLLAAIALMAAIGYGTADIVSFRRRCVDCETRLPLRRWFGGAHRCDSCELHHLAHLIEEAERRRGSK
jgi:rRNA maturation endonuclease Nob1